MTPTHIFCQCMKPWKLCVNKKTSYKIDVRDLIDLYTLKPIIHVGKGNYYNPNFNINYDFINKQPLKKNFRCRFLCDS
jgi:hypothetical protein